MTNGLRLRHVREVFRLLGEISELRADPLAAHRHAVTGLCRFTGARQGALLHWRGFTPTGDVKLLHFADGGWACPDAAREWADVMRGGNWRDDPILDRATRIPARLATRFRQQLVPDAEWRRSPCADLVRRAEIDHHLVSWYRRDPPDHVSGLALHRLRGDPHFSERDRRVLHLFTLESCRLYRTHAADLRRRRHDDLSPRQRQVLDRLLAGDSVKQVALRLELSHRTIEDYVKVLYRTYGVHSRAELSAKLLAPDTHAAALV